MTKPESAAGYIVAVDVGGTCTDCVVFRDGEPFRFGKALSTPPNFAQGVLDSLAGVPPGHGGGALEDR